MAWPKARKSESREEILESASRLFTAYGYDTISIGDVMKNAGKTHGGFYSHFSSKNQLYAEAITKAAKMSMDKHWDTNINTVFRNYLSMSHVNLKDPSCPLAFLTTDVATKEEEIRDVYTNVFQGFSALIEHNKQVEDKEVSYAISAMLIGGVAIARALTDEQLAQDVLDSCRKVCEQVSSNKE